ncbi:hypothetical protein C8R45DRAFT_1012721 [Mycena sanguinolenta]|nr:hypothetical protein C8R45DRAFT_1012721 [Mycena sanguinolenta]
MSNSPLSHDSCLDHMLSSPPLRIALTVHEQSRTSSLLVAHRDDCLRWSDTLSSPAHCAGRRPSSLPARWSLLQPPLALSCPFCVAFASPSSFTLRRRPSTPSFARRWPLSPPSPLLILLLVTSSPQWLPSSHVPLSLDDALRFILHRQTKPTREKCGSFSCALAGMTAVEAVKGSWRPADTVS